MTEFPVHEELDVQTVFKDDTWWKAVVLYEGYRGPEIGVYLWQHRDDDWRRQQKCVIRPQDDWEKDKALIEEFITEL